MKFYKYFLIFLLIFLSFGALYGGILFMLAPNGSAMGMKVDLLKDSLFSNFFIPGLILFFTFGIWPLYVAYALLKKPNNTILQKLNFWKDYHFAWTFTLYIGIALITWIHIQMLILKTIDTLHTIFTFYGLLIICISLLSASGNNFKK